MIKRGLILVDLQNDFFPGGALAIKESRRILPVVNVLLKKKWDVIVASQDWHPSNHLSFAENHPGKVPGDRVSTEEGEQILWPVHCVQGSHGAEFAAGWESGAVHKRVLKGVEPHLDSYSTFFDNAHRRDTGLADFLKAQGIQEVYMAGLATDYCVKYSALDALNLGFETYVIKDACEGVDLQPGDSQRAMEEVRKRGGHILLSRDLLF